MAAIGMLASDDQNPEFVGARNPDDILYVTFYERAVSDEFESKKQGRPIFRNADFIKILKPGDNTTEIDTYATEADKHRFHRQWEMYQRKKGSEQIIGTPLAEWPILSKSEVEELRALKFFTVEQLAGASDLQMQALGMMGPKLKQQAVAFLSKAEDKAKPQADAARIAELEAQVKQLMEAQAKVSAEANFPKPKRKYTRKPKDEQVA
jgi:hypothetical protein